MKPITYRDDIARMNREMFAREKREGKHWTIPWLDLDVGAYRRYREGETETLPKPYCDDDPTNRLVMAGASGKKVLCLAGGGGQQSAVFSLLGAQVTVLDLTPEQLEGDRQAADHFRDPRGVGKPTAGRGGGCFDPRARNGPA